MLRQQPVTEEVHAIRARWDGAALFLLAFLARFVAVLQIQSNDLFGIPIVDAAAYVDQARGLAGGTPISEALFWQPIAYPLFLSLIFRVAGPSLPAARVVQALLGALSCLVLFSWVRRFDSRRTAWTAGLLLAFCGPVIALESDLLSEGLTVFAAAALLWLFARTGSGARSPALAGLGAAGGLAILIRPTFIPFVAGAGLWLTSMRIRRRGWKAGSDAALTWGAGLMVLLLPAAALCRQHTGRFTVLPSSSGLNLYLGNNPRWVETVSIRPGVEWTALIREPQAAGLSNIWDQSDYFRTKVAEYARTRPGDFARGLFRKTARFFCSREIPRNHDLYLLPEASPWLKPLLWKAGGFGFPFGLLLPLALLGLLIGWRRLGATGLLFLALYPPPVIAVFASDRYRLPMIPVAAAAAALGLVWFWRTLAARRWGRALLATAALAAAAALISLPRSYPEERLAFRAERHWAVGKRLADSGRAGEAERHLRRAAELEPGMVDAWNDLGVLLEKLGRGAEAVEAYQRAVALDPANEGLRRNLDAALRER